MEKKEKENNSIKKYPWRRYIALSGIVIVLVLLTLIAAKYQTFFQSGNGQMTSKSFYFTTDLLGNEAMVDSSGTKQGQYQYEDVQEGTWHLYGGGKHEISIHLRNYYDELRVTEGTIAYEASVEAVDKDNKTVENLATLQLDQPESTSQTTVTGSLSPVGETKQAEEELILNIQSHEEQEYDEGTTVVVTITSTEPYQKKMKLFFKLYKVDTYLSCEIRDKENSPYAEMIIMTNVINENTGGGSDSGIQPYLTWTENLSIDNTNSMTFTYEKDIFTQVDGMEKRKIQIAGKLVAGESRSIYFFKKDTGRNYDRDRTIIDPEENGDYVISIGN